VSYGYFIVCERMWDDMTTPTTIPLHKPTFAVVAAIAVALSLAVLPALTSQAFAAFPNPGKGHTEQCTNPGGQVREGDCPGQSEKAEPIKEQTRAGKSHVVKSEE
jgi:hypothetical protein